MTVVRVLLGIVASIAIAAIAGWGSLALFYRAPFEVGLRQVLATLFVLWGLAAIVGLWIPSWRRLLVGCFAVGCAVLLLWWRGIAASNDRDWQPDVAVLPYAEVQGNLVTVHNIRNFSYRSETDFTPRYYDKTFDLNALDTVDLVASYWMGDAIAHIFVSFGFAGRDYLAFSIETRKERSESYSTLAGFFKEYELYYVVADERDVIGVRTTYRKDPPEDVYLYRTNAPPENVRRLFLSYIASINSLREQPEFYNTLTTNCTTSIWVHTKVNGATALNWKILASGYVPLLAYERGRLDTTLPFEELRQRGHINAAAQAAGDAADFSQRIRANVPLPRPALEGGASARPPTLEGRASARP
jgi:hypothetical protein